MAQSPVNLSQPIDPALSKTLDALKPIHYPNETSWWPPAPGYIGLIVIVLIISYIVGKNALSKINYYFSAKPKKLALAEMQKIEAELSNINQQPIEVNKIIYGSVIQKTCILLKKSAISKHEHSKSLSGERWLEFLSATGKTDNFNTDIGKLITTLTYQDNLNDYTEVELAEKTKKLITLTKQWVKDNL